MNKRPRATFRVGQRIEFRSGEGGGCWKPGVVARGVHPKAKGAANLRIRVGEGVWIVRPAKKCRLAGEVAEAV